MKRPWPIIAVADVAKSSAWYVALLNAHENHPGASVFNQILADDGTILLCLHCWGPSGPMGDRHWPSLADAGQEPDRKGKGLLLWFVVDDFDLAWERARSMDVNILEEPNTNNGTGMRAFAIRDLDAYYVVVNEERPEDLNTETRNGK